MEIIEEPKALPAPDSETGLRILSGLVRDRSLLTAMTAMRDQIGPAFKITMPGFQPAVMVGPHSNRQIMVSQSEHFHWRNPSDPVTKLLRHGLLVEDGQKHAWLRSTMEPAMHKPKVMPHIPLMQTYTDQVIDAWSDNSVQDMLVEMRRVALLIFMGTLLDVPFEDDMARLWQPILKAIKYISPGLWIVWPDMPRPGFSQPLAELDAYLYKIIAERRIREAKREAIEPADHTDLLTHLVHIPQMDDDLIRDQILTMLIAGHDTSTALLAWALHLLARQPGAMQRAVDEVMEVVGSEDISEQHVNNLPYLDMLIKETLRLYPPIHVGNRMVANDTVVCGYELKAGSRLMASIYLSHRDQRYWDQPQQFNPQRFERGADKPPPLTYIPFGAGKRTCIGAAFAQVEAKVVLARILQRFQLVDTGRKVKTYMGATLEPRPGVFLRVHRRQDG